MRETTTVYLNTWGAYNNGSIGYGWMTATQAKEFIETIAPIYESKVGYPASFYITEIGDGGREIK